MRYLKRWVEAFVFGFAGTNGVDALGAIELSADLPAKALAAAIGATLTVGLVWAVGQPFTDRYEPT